MNYYNIIGKKKYKEGKIFDDYDIFKNFSLQFLLSGE